MHTILKKNADIAYEHYKRLNYEYQEGLIPMDVYCQEIKLVRDYLSGISEQLEQIAQSLGVEQ